MSKVDVKYNFRNSSRTKINSLTPLEKTIEEKEASISFNPTIKLNSHFGIWERDF